MKKITIAFLILFSVTKITFAQNPNKNIDEAEKLIKGVNGKIKSFKYETYAAIEENGKVKKGRLEISSSVKFDSLGRRTELTTQYDSKTYKYNDKGLLTERLLFTNNKLANGKDTYIYDDNGNLIEFRHANNKGKINSKSKYKYDDNKQIIELTQYNSDSIPAYTIKYKYDNKNMIEETYFKPDGKFDFKVEYKYNANGDITEKTNYPAIGSNGAQKSAPVSNGEANFIVEIKYDNRGNKIEESQYLTGRKLEQQFIYKYNDANLLIQEISYLNGVERANVTHKISESDKNKNWLKQSNYMKGKLISVSEREITFYETKK